MTVTDPRRQGELDTGSNPEFFEYYAQASESRGTLERFDIVRRKVLSLLDSLGEVGPYDVADIGCGAGTQAMLWAADGHRVVALDVNGPLVELGQQRAADHDLEISFHVGTATDLPWKDASVDVCLVPELLEHVTEWETCLDQFARIMKPGGVLYLSTTNYLCPRQQEFDLPFYSWYPARLKHHYERQSVTTRPELVNHAKYPAVNWFTPYYLARELRDRDFTRILDRFDALGLATPSTTNQAITMLTRVLPPLRWVGHLCTPSTTLFAVMGGS